jgi:hypothetical protein
MPITIEQIFCDFLFCQSLSLSLFLSFFLSLCLHLSLLSSINKRLFGVFRMSVQHARYADTVGSCFAYRVDANRAEVMIISQVCTVRVTHTQTRLASSQVCLLSLVELDHSNQPHFHLGSEPDMILC